MFSMVFHGFPPIKITFDPSLRTPTPMQLFKQLASKMWKPREASEASPTEVEVQPDYLGIICYNRALCLYITLYYIKLQNIVVVCACGCSV